MDKYTVDDIMNLRPCPKYTGEFVAELWAGHESISLTDMCRLNIPVGDIIWAVTRLIPARDARLFACDCAEHVLHIYEAKYFGDSQPRKCIEVIRSWIEGKVDDGSHAVAKPSDWDAAVAFAEPVAWASACVSDWAVELKWQLGCLVTYVENDKQKEKSCT